MLVFENEFAALISELRRTCHHQRYIAIDQAIPEADLFLEDLMMRGSQSHGPISFPSMKMRLAKSSIPAAAPGNPKGW